MRYGDAELQRAQKGFEAVGDFVGGSAGRERYWSADANGDFAKMGKAAALALHLPDSIQAHRNNRDAQIFGQEADAALERSHAPILGIVDFAFGENEHAVAAVNGIAGKAEAFAKAGKLRQWENVEQQRGKPVAELIRPTLGEEPITRRTSHVLQRFAAHGRGKPMAISRRQRGENQADVGAARDVIGDNEHGPAKAAKIFTARDTRVAENLRCGPDKRVIHGEPQPADGFTLRPARIAVFAAARGRLLQDALDVGNSLRVGEGVFVYFHVHPFLQ